MGYNIDILLRGAVWISVRRGSTGESEKALGAVGREDEIGTGFERMSWELLNAVEEYDKSGR